MISSKVITPNNVYLNCFKSCLSVFEFCKKNYFAGMRVSFQNTNSLTSVYIRVKGKDFVNRNLEISQIVVNIQDLHQSKSFFMNATHSAMQTSAY